jgi:hypothetical protein
MNKKIGITIGCLLLLGLGALFFGQRKKTSPLSPQEFLQFQPASPATPLVLPAESMESIKSCVKALETQDLEKELFARLANPEPKLVWKIWHVKGEGEKQYRIRLSNEPSEKGPEALVLKIFTVDSEELPDLKETDLENPLGTLSDFMADKHILFQVESMDYVGKNGTTLHLEREDGKAVEIEFLSPKGRLACSGKSELSCHCFAPKTPPAVDDEDLPEDHPDRAGEAPAPPTDESIVPTENPGE